MSTHTPSCVLLCGCKERSFVMQGNNNDPDAILEGIEKLDKAMHSLRILKSEHLRLLNATRSLTKILPNEILLSIFQLFCSLSESRRFPQSILGGVCSLWRNLINSSPQFWKIIDLQTQNIYTAESLLQTFKGGNRATFEFIHLKFERLIDETHFPFQQLLHSIRGVSALQRIAVTNAPVALLRSINNNPDTSDVSLTGLSYIIKALESVPGLSLPWSTLTILKLSWVRINICYDLLLGCPNLIQFSCSDPSEPPIGYMRPSAHHTRETCLPHLQYLRWYHDWSEWDDTFLSSCRFPALQHFHWCGGEHYYSFELFHDFTSFLPQSCRVFQLSCTTKYDAKLERESLLQIEHPFEQLICLGFGIFSLSVVLEGLRNPTFMPSLTFFRWEHRDIWYMNEERILRFTRLFNDILRNRNEIGVEKFRMEIGGYSEPDEHDRKKIYELMSGGGFYFEIAQNGYWIMSF